MTENDVSTAGPVPGTNGGKPPGGPLTSVQFNTGPRHDMPVALLVEMLEGIAKDSPALFSKHYLLATTGISDVIKSSGGRPRKAADK